jgi:glucose/arabinose dehydrogenase
MASNLGKVVRIDPDGSIPKDNPFVGKDGASPEIWTLGHRNELGAAINPASGELWIHEMGPKGGDEVNIVVRGKNYGWPQVSEGAHYDDQDIPDHKTKPEFATPAYSWNPSISPAGLMFYTGDKFPAWKGKAMLGGLSSEALIVLTLNGDKVVSDDVIKMGRRIRDVAQAPTAPCCCWSTAKAVAISCGSRRQGAPPNADAATAARSSGSPEPVRAEVVSTTG